MLGIGMVLSQFVALAEQVAPRIVVKAGKRVPAA